MQFQNPFNARAVEPSSAPTPLPPNDYKVMIIDSKIEAVNTGNGGRLRLVCRIIEGEYLNREFNYDLNIYHNNAQTAEIANHALSAVCHVVGVFDIQDSQQLHNIPFIAVITMQKGSSEYNDVKGVKYLDGTQPGKQKNNAVGAGQPPAAAPAAPPANGGWQTPAAPAPAAPVAHDPMAAAVADGWIKHPNTAGYHYKGQEVKTDAEVAALYPAKQTWNPPAPAVPSVPAVPAAPVVPPADAGGWRPPAAATTGAVKAPWEK
jgi:hypothetical protein